MPALNTTQGHSRVNGENVVYLHRGHTARHELHDHCTPQDHGDTVIDHIEDIAGLVAVIGLAGLLWVAAGCPGLHVIVG